MTETDDGAGSDPSLLNTIAAAGRRRLPDQRPQVHDHRRAGAAFNIVMARTLDPAGKDLGATMFLVDIDAPGFRVDRMLDTIDSNSPGGHAEV